MVVLRLGGCWLVLYGVYLLLTVSVSPEELVAGALVASAGVAAMAGLRFHTERRFSVRLSWLLWLLVRLPAQAITQCGPLLRALVRPADQRLHGIGAVRRIPFDTTSGRTPAEAAGRRALVTAAISFAPNTFLLRMEEHPGHLLLHQLIATPEPPGGGDPLWPV